MLLKLHPFLLFHTTLNGLGEVKQNFENLIIWSHPYRYIPPVELAYLIPKQAEHVTWSIHIARGK